MTFLHFPLSTIHCPLLALSASDVYWITLVGIAACAFVMGFAVARLVVKSDNDAVLTTDNRQPTTSAPEATR